MMVKNNLLFAWGNCACTFGLEHPETLRDVLFVQQIVRACGCKLQKY